MTIAPTRQQIMSDMFIDNERVGARRFKVSAATRQELQIAKGDFFTGASIRTGIPVNNDYYAVIKAPSDKFLAIEDAIIETDFSVVDSSNFGVSLVGYVDASNGNSWSYTPSNPVPIGRPLNAGLINELATGTIDLGVTANVTGDPDYPIFFADYYLETQGNRESISTTGTSFFDKGRQILLAPNQEALIRTQTTGNSLGTLELKTIFFTSEISIEEAPSVLGVNI